MADQLKEDNSSLGTKTTSLPGDSPSLGAGHPNRSTSVNGGTPRTPSAAETHWEKTTLQKTLDKSPERQKTFTTISGHPIRRIYTEADLAGWDATRDLGFPGVPPYTRGIHS